MANSTAVLNAEGAAFTKFGFALITVSDRVSIGVIDASHSRSLGYKEKERAQLLLKKIFKIENLFFRASPVRIEHSAWRIAKKTVNGDKSSSCRMARCCKL
jgi:hypothetical protein